MGDFMNLYAIMVQFVFFMQEAQVAHYYYSDIVRIIIYNILMQKGDIFTSSDSRTMTSTTGKTAYAALQTFLLRRR